MAIKPRPVRVWNANINGDDMPHIPGRFDVLGLQEFHPEQTNELKKLFPKKVLHAPGNGHYNLGILLNPNVFEVVSDDTYLAHPSGDEMRQGDDWHWNGNPLPKNLVTPIRGVYEVLGYWFGDKDLPGFIRVGHRINRGPSQPWRDHLGELFDAVVRDRNKATRKSAGVEMYDYNQQHPKASPGMTWVANHSTDHIGASSGSFSRVGDQAEGPQAGHSGRVHHASLGVTLKLSQ